MKRKPKILAYGDSPCIHSGFGNVMREIIDNNPQFDWLVYGINDAGLPHQYDFHIVPAFNRFSPKDFYGKANFCDVLFKHLGEIDLVFMLQDHFILSSFFDDSQEQRFIDRVKEICDKRAIPLITYFPIDGVPRAEWIDPIFAKSNFAVTYTIWGKMVCQAISKTLGKKVQVMPHGANLDDYRPLDEPKEKLRRKWLGNAYRDDLFVCFYCGQNQRRKMLDWVLIYAAQMAKAMPDRFMMVLHTQPDSPLGWRVGGVLEMLDLSPDNVRFASPDKILSRAEMNEFYNLADYTLLPSAEGWGLPATESMAAGTPTLLGDHTSLAEIGGNGRSLLINTPDDPNFFTIMPRDNEVIRRRPDVNDAVEKSLWLAAPENGEQVAEMVAKASDYMKELEWKGVAQRWGRLFQVMIDGRTKGQKPKPLHRAEDDDEFTPPTKGDAAPSVKKDRFAKLDVLARDYFIERDGEDSDGE